MNIVDALIRVKNELLNFIVLNLHNKAETDHSHSYNDLDDIPTNHATVDYVDNKVSSMVNSSPEVLEALKELSDALENDANFATTITTQIGNKVDKVDGMGLSSNDYTDEDKEKLAGIEDGANKTIIDVELSPSSINPVQNKAVYGALENKADVYVQNDEPEDALDGSLWVDIDVNVEADSDIPQVTVSDNGKFMRVVDGVWAAVNITVAEEMIV